ncbi:MAG TPA: putative baseplate assembly protein [Thermoanaerobaculia bacterium]|nr:putative baseplate assembly protein [Thermoanaerobaculia bacterium]
MSAPWWGRETVPGRAGRMVPAPASGGPAGIEPELASASRAEVLAELRGRAPRYTPEWTGRRADDAGQALARLFGEQLEPVLERVNRLPEKALVEVLSAAGVAPLPATPASLLLRFEIALEAPASTLIPRGFQVAARPVGEGDLVIFETERSLFAAPARIVEMHRQQGSVFVPVDPSSVAGVGAGSPVQPFGAKPRPGNALLFGLSGEATPGPSLTVGIGVARPAGSPPPAPAGGVLPQPEPGASLLRWEILDGGAFRPVEVTLDQTGGLIRSGVVELRLPPRWRPGRPDGLDGVVPLRWLRLRLLRGRFATVPALSLVALNLAAATATRTFRNEILEPVAGSGGRALSLRRTPVLPGSLILEVAEGGFDDRVADPRERPDLEPETEAELQLGETAPGVARWREVPDLALAGPDDRVYTLDALTGRVGFGDGVRGAALPPGVRHVRALSYRVGGGASGAVPAGAANNPVSSAAFLTKVENPLPASGGTDLEARPRTLRRGPEEIRARERAVGAADFPVLALRARGARVARAHALSGVHPAFPGRLIPGVVAVFVVARDGAPGEPPIPTEEDLRAVAAALAAQAAPAGAEVVAAAPRFRRLRAEADLVLDPAVDTGRAVTRVLDEIDGFLHPLTGGDDGEGWPFGRTLEHNDLLRRLVALPGVRAVPRLILTVDGVRRRGCTDVPLGPGELFWPERHEVVPVEEDGA